MKVRVGFDCDDGIDKDKGGRKWEEWDTFEFPDGTDLFECALKIQDKVSEEYVDNGCSGRWNVFTAFLLKESLAEDTDGVETEQ